MNHKKKYSFIGLDNTCILTEKNINISSPDITSIIDAFENNENPTDLFSEINNESCSKIIKKQLIYICENLENIKMWFDRTLIPSLQMMNNDDVRQCIPIVGLIDTKMYQLASMSKKIRKQYHRKRLSRPQSCYDAVCPICYKFYYLKSPKDWQDFENHDHITEILSSGTVFNLPLPNDDITTDIDNCKEITSNLNRNDDLTDEPSDNSGTNAKQFIKNTLPLCLYNAQVRNILYPLNVTSRICSAENNYQFYTVQANTSTKFHCLVCKVDMQTDKCVYTHVYGNKHKIKLCDRNISSIVRNYHSIFSSLPHEMQIHQVVFNPSYRLGYLSCKVCSIQVNSESILQHINTDKHKIRLNIKKFTKYNFFDEMLKSVGMDPNNSEDDSSEMSIPSQIIYNSDNKLNTLISKTGPISSHESKTDISKESESTEEGEDSEEETSETSSKSQSVIEENALTQSVDDPQQGTSNMESVILTKKETSKKIKVTNEDKNGQTSKLENSKNNDNKPAPIKHYIVPAFKENPEKMFDYIENRYQINLEYIKFANTNPQCTLCMKTIPRQIKDIKNHFISNEHKQNAEIHCGKQKYTYYCDLCYKYMHNEIKWTEHLSCIEHKQREEAIKKNKEQRGGPFKEYECTICCLVLYGNNSTINKHLKENFGASKRIRKVKEIKLPSQLVTILRSEQLFSEEIYRLSKESTEALRSIELSWECCKGIEKALEPIFGQCKAYPFGSRVSGLGNLVSDLDVFVDTGLMYEGIYNQDSESQARLVSQTARVLKKHKDFVDVFAIPNARTPIVQVFHKVTGLDCDLSFRHGLSVENTEFLRLCIDVQPKLKTLILFLKRWFYFCKLCDRISTYALSMLCIFYFQQKGFLPSVKTLREIDSSESKVIAGWQTFCFKKPLTELNMHFSPCNMFTRDILMGFFEFYMTFKFNKEVICPLLGHTVFKSDFYEEKGKRLPPEMIIYVNKINENEENEVFRSMSPMCIQDPFDLSHNLTKACPVDLVHRFVALCQLSHTMLCKKG